VVQEARQQLEVVLTEDRSLEALRRTSWRTIGYNSRKPKSGEDAAKKS
jgi:hypothetical protein